MPVRNPQMGERIKSLRAGRTLQDVAQRAGIYAGDLQRYEAGRLPRGDILERLAVVLGVSSRWLLTGSDKYVEIVADPFEHYEPKDPRRRLVLAVKRFALNADDDLVRALLENVKAFKELMERRQSLREKTKTEE